MRYIVTKTDKENEFLFTHIEERELLDGTKVEVLKGKNVIAIDKLEQKISELNIERAKQYDMLDKNEIKRLVDNYKAECKANLQTMDIQLKSLLEMQEAINKVISE